MVASIISYSGFYAVVMAFKTGRTKSLRSSTVLYLISADFDRFINN